MKGLVCSILLLLSWIPSVTAQGNDYLSGCALLLKKDYAGAAERFTLSIGYNNASEKTFLKRGEAYLRQGDYALAIKDFDEANLIFPGVSELWLARADALSGDNQGAIEHLKNHLASEFRLPEDSIKKDPAFDRLQQSNDWYTLWEKEWFTALDKTVADITYYMKKGMTDKALALVNDEINALPGNPRLLVLRGSLSMQLGNHAAAIADFNQAAGMDKKGRLTQDNAAGMEDIVALRGMAHLKAGKYKEAVSDLSRTLKDNPENFGMYLNRASANAALQNWDAAIRDVQTYLRYFAEDAGAVYQCGRYYYDAEDYMNALKFFNRNLKEDPNNSRYYKARGMTYLKTATYRYAVSDLSMSLDLDPEDSETWMYLGVAKILTGDKENGCSDLEKARQMGSTEAVKYMLENCK